MMYKAEISFTGIISMTKGDVREISDVSLANDLLKAGYIKQVTEKKTKSPNRKGNKK